MEKLTVAFLENADYDDAPLSIAERLSEVESHYLRFTPWSAFPYHPAVSFNIAYTNDCLILKYRVREKAIRAVNNVINGSIWEDSCVEFFVSWDNGVSYYNLEFNCMGFGLIGFGKERTNRERLLEDVIETIKFHATITNQMKPQFDWALTMMIPFSVFKHHTIMPKKGLKCQANFYKCGDKLPEPHYITWSNIEFHKPNFHLPAFFGQLTFG